MTAPSTQSTNSIDDPRHIIPVETTLGAVTSKFQHKVPGYAIQVIEFNQQ
jgi:alpha-L-arabinofuranosidase